MFGGNGGGRTRHQTKVHLNLYDLSPANDCLYPLGFGLHHSGVEILGSEYSFASGGGIFESPPGEAPGAKFRERIDLGSFDGGSSELKVVLDSLRGNGFGSDDYHLLRKNCNHFANALVWALLRKPIPPHINRLADVANCFVWLLPKKLLEDSPIGPNGGRQGQGSSSTNAGYQVFGGSRGTASGGGGSSAPTAAFIGRGARLGVDGGDADGDVAARTSGTGASNGLFGFGGGGTSSEITGTDGGSKKDELTDRREKARQAALARMERNSGTAKSAGGQ